MNMFPEKRLYDNYDFMYPNTPVVINKHHLSHFRLSDFGPHEPQHAILIKEALTLCKKGPTGLVSRAWAVRAGVSAFSGLG